MPISYTLDTEAVDLPFQLTDLFAYPPASVSELFRQLSYGELHDLKLGLDGAGTIKADRRDQVVHLANEGLQELHQRFPLITVTEEVVVPAGTTPLEVPLGAAVIGVVSMLTTSGTSLTFLTHPVPGKIFIYNGVLYFPPSCREYEVQVTYKKRHPLLRPIEEDSDLEQPLYLLRELWAALRAYIAGEVYGNMNTQDAQVTAAKYRSRYEQVCARVEASGGVAQGMLDDQKFGRRGFV